MMYAYILEPEIPDKQRTAVFVGSVGNDFQCGLVPCAAGYWIVKTATAVMEGTMLSVPGYRSKFLVRPRDTI